MDGRFLVARANEGNAASPTTASSSLEESWEGGRWLDSAKRNDLKDQQKMNKGVRIGAFKSLKKGAAAPMPAAQGGKGVEQLERVSVARNLTS